MPLRRAELFHEFARRKISTDISVVVREESHATIYQMLGRKENIKTWRRWLIIMGLTWYAVALFSVLNKSASIDEFAHIAGGFAVLGNNDHRMNPEHPPLMKVLGVLPFYLFYPPYLDVSTDSGAMTLSPWLDSLQSEYGYYLLFLAPADHTIHSGSSVKVRLLLIRLVPMLFGLLGGYLAWRWGRLLGRTARAGFLAAFFLLWYPEYIGHARFLTFDVPLLFSCALITYLAYQWWLNPGLKQTILFVLLGNLVTFIKLPIGVFLAVEMLLLSLLVLFSRGRIPIKKLLLLWLAFFLVWWAMTWTMYGFRFSHIPEGAPIEKVEQYIPPGKGDGAVVKVANFLWEHKLLPEGFIATLLHIGSFGHRVQFLFGEHERRGWYEYFLITYILKTPLTLQFGFIALLAFGVRFVRLQFRKANLLKIQRNLLFLLPFFVLLVLIIRSKANLGHRYILFVYFPLCCYLGVLVDRWLRQTDWKRCLAWLLIAGQALSIATTYPHFATYFHFLIGSPYHGAAYLRDSNVDWGQDVALAVQALKKEGWDVANYAVFGHNRPESFGMRDYNWVMVGYPFAVYVKPPNWANPNLPSMISLNNLNIVADLYDGEPDIIVNSILIFLPDGRPFTGPRKPLMLP
jgi:hypothetical protein